MNSLVFAIPIAAAVVAAGAVAPAARAQAPGDCDDTLPYGFVSTTYSLIGKRPADGPDGEAYSGAMRIEVRADCTMTLVRCVDGARIQGQARFERVTGDRIPVLMTVFVERGRDFEGRFKIDADLDNYPILTGPYRVRGDDRQRLGWEFGYVDRRHPAECR